MPKALFLSYGGGHVKMLIPVIRELDRGGDWSKVVIGLTTAAAILDAENIPSRGFRHYLQPGDDPAIAWGHRLAETMHSDGHGILREESEAYLGLSMQELVDQVGSDVAQAQVREQGRWAFSPQRTVRRILAAERPDVVITTNSPRAEYATILVARALGIPSVMVLDLFGRFRPDKMIADHVCVLSELTRTNLVELGGIDPTRVHVTGNPAFDAYADLDLDITRTRAREHWGIMGSERVVMLALEPTPAAPSMLEAMCSWAQRSPQHRVLVRQHPNRPASDLDPLIADARRVIMASPGHVPLGDVLCASDVVVTASSTVGIEACLLGKPLVSLVLDSSGADDAPYADLGLALGVDMPEHLPDATDRAFDDPDVVDRLTRGRTRVPPPGGAAKAVATIIRGAVDSLT